MPSKEHIKKNTAKAAEIKKKEREQKFLAIKGAIIRHNGHIYKALEEVGVPHKTYNQWLIKYPEFDSMVKEAMEFLINNAVETIHSAAAQGDTDAAKYILSRKARHLGWGDKVDVNLNMEKEILEWLERVRK